MQSRTESKNPGHCIVLYLVSNYRSSCQNIAKGGSEKPIGINTNPLIENGPKGDIIIEEPKIPLQFSTTAMVTVSDKFTLSNLTFYTKIRLLELCVY